MILISAAFTRNGGQPATGLVLGDVDLYLTSRNRGTGAVAVIWNGAQNPTEEITNTGIYTRPYTLEDTTTFDYFVRATYTGAAVLDLDDVTGALVDLTPPEIFAEVVEATLTFEDFLRVMFAVLAGLSTGGGTATNRFRDVADAMNRVVATVDANGNRTAITVDGS